MRNIIFCSSLFHLPLFSCLSLGFHSILFLASFWDVHTISAFYFLFYDIYMHFFLVQSRSKCILILILHSFFLLHPNLEVGKEGRGRGKRETPMVTSDQSVFFSLVWVLLTLMSNFLGLCYLLIPVSALDKQSYYCLVVFRVGLWKARGRQPWS